MSIQPFTLSQAENTPLISASCKDNADVVKLFLEAGANKEAKDHVSQTRYKHTSFLNSIICTRLYIINHIGLIFKDHTAVVPRCPITRTRTNTNPNDTEANAAGRNVRACVACKSKS